jgi:hypothetical protein
MLLFFLDYFSLEPNTLTLSQRGKERKFKTKIKEENKEGKKKGEFCFFGKKPNF